MRTRERQRAIKIIWRALAKSDDTTIKKVLCAVVGHPPVLETFFGYQTCARCGEQLGDSLAGVSVATSAAVVGHNCEKCAGIWRSLSPEQRLLTLNPVTGDLVGEED